MAVFAKVFATSALVVAGSALTALPATAEGTQAQRMACMSDAMALCSSDIPNADRIAACLRREQAHVSLGCRQEMGVPTRSVSLKQ